MSHVKNSFELYNTLQGTKILEKDILISSDITSLFTNISQELVMEGIINRW